MDKKPIPADVPWELTDSVHRIENHFANTRANIVSESDEMLSRVKKLVK